MSKLISKTSSTVKLDIIVTRNSGHEDIFGLWIDSDDDVDIAKAAVDHGAASSIDTGNVEDEAVASKIGFAGVFFLLDFDFDFADDFEIVFVSFAFVSVKSGFISTRVQESDIRWIVDGVFEKGSDTVGVSNVGVGLFLCGFFEFFSINEVGDTVESFTTNIVEGEIIGVFVDDNVINTVLSAIVKVIIEEGHSLLNFDEAKDAGDSKSDTDNI